MINIYGKGGHARVVNSALKYPKKIMYWNDDDFKDNIEGHWIIAKGFTQNQIILYLYELGDVSYLTIRYPIPL